MYLLTYTVVKRLPFSKTFRQVSCSILFVNTRVDEHRIT